MINGIGAIGGIDPGFKANALSGLSNIPAGGQAAMPGLSFMDALGQVAGNTVERLGQAENLSIQALQGEVPTRDVVDAVMSAEQSLQAAIAIRDKIVTAWLDLSRMAI